MKCFGRRSSKAKRLRCLLRLAEELNQDLQVEAQAERDQRIELMLALQKESDISKAIEQKMYETTARLLAELDQNKQDGQNALDKKNKDIQDLQEDLHRLQQEKNMIQTSLRERTESMTLRHTQQENQIHLLQQTLCDERNEVCRLQTQSTNLQDKLELQNQLNQDQSNALEMSHRNLEEMQENNDCLEDLMELKNQNIIRLVTSLSQTKANLADQKQDTRNALDQADVAQGKLCQEMEKNKELQQQVQALMADLKRSKEEAKKITEQKMEEMEKNKGLQEQMKALMADLERSKEDTKKCAQEKMQEMEKNKDLQEQLQALMVDLENSKKEAQKCAQEKMDEMEKNKGLQEQIKTLMVDLQRSKEEAKNCAQEKMEEMKKNQKLEDMLAEKNKTILHMENIIAKNQTESDAMKMELQSMKEAMVRLEQSMNEEKKILQGRIDCSDQRNEQLQTELNTLKYLSSGWLNSFYEAFAIKSHLEQVNMQLHQEIQRLTQTCQMSQEAKRVLDNNTVKLMDEIDLKNMVNVNLKNELMEAMNHQKDLDDARLQMWLKCAELQKELDEQSQTHQQVVKSISKALEDVVIENIKLKDSIELTSLNKELLQQNQASEIQTTEPDEVLTEIENLQITIPNNNNNEPRQVFITPGRLVLNSKN